MISLIFVALNLSRAWFTEIKNDEIRQTTLYVHNPSLPIYLSAGFNQFIFEDYTNEELVLAKTFIPGDVLNVSTFIDLRDETRADIIEVKVSGIPDWLFFLDNSAEVRFADVTTGADVLPLKLNTSASAVVVFPPAVGSGEMVFQFEVPENYTDYHGLCLNFQIYFEDTFEIQNDLMNQSIKLRFSATDVS